MDFLDRISELQPNGSGERHRDGFYEAREYAHDVMIDASSYICKLEYYIRKMAGGEVLEMIREEVGVV